MPEIKQQTIYRSLNVTPETHKKLKVVSAQEGITIVEMIDKSVDLYIKESKKKK